VNLLLLERGELDAGGEAVLKGRRARHVATVLRAAPGQRLRAGLVDGPVGHAEVLAVDGETVRVRADCREPAPPAADVLLLAVPRPKVLLRAYEQAAALGFGTIVLFRSWRVDKSHLQSRALDPAVQREHLRLGLEQGRRTAVPAVRFFARFRPFVEDALDALQLPCHRFCAHPDGSASTAALALTRGAPFALALGPEGGFLPWEVDQLAARGFLPVRLGCGPLRTEWALGALWAQLDLLRRQG
jgi:RsmE family RNA methyltransferase